MRAGYPGLEQGAALHRLPQRLSQRIWFSASLCSQFVGQRFRLLVEGLIYLVNDDGVASCIEAKTGETVWKERWGGNFSASAIYADGRLYFFSRDAETTVLAPGRECKVLAVNQLDGELMASPAAAGKAFFLRTRTHLYRIENR